MFKVGDKAVYPAHGVGVIKGVEKKEISGNKLTFYILQIIETDITIMVPTNNVDRVGLRCLIKKRDIPKILKLMQNSGILHVYDVDKKGWRSVPFNNVEYLQAGNRTYKIQPIKRIGAKDDRSKEKGQRK